jgi:hypothetical protein
MKRIPVVLLTVVALTGCDSPLLRPPEPVLGEPLTAEQLQEVLVGNSLVKSPEDVPPLVLYFSPDGQLKGQRSTNYEDQGTWRIDADAVCGAWDNWFGTMSSCWQVFRHDGMITLKNAERGESVRASLVAGDAITPQ